LAADSTRAIVAFEIFRSSPMPLRTNETVAWDSPSRLANWRPEIERAGGA
jgi:hypothetical protein